MCEYTPQDYWTKGLYFTGEYSNARVSLGFGCDALEEKFRDSQGIISIKTRGQLGLASRLSALTGIERKDSFSITELRTILIEKLNSKESKSLDYGASRLLGGPGIIKKGGHVTTIPIEKVYNVKYDNRRCINPIPNEGPYGPYFDSTPHHSISEIHMVRGIAKLDGSKYSSRQP